MTNTSKNTKRLVGMAIFTAIIVVLQLLGSFVKVGPFSVSLVLIPMVVGAAIYGPRAGAFFGGVFGVIVLIACINGADPGGYILWTANPALTAVLCLGKGIAAGLMSGLVYGWCSKKTTMFGVVCAAVVCPIVNTGLFCLGMSLFFYDTLVAWAGDSSVIYYVLFGLAGVNFLLELAANVIFSPMIVRIIGARKKI